MLRVLRIGLLCGLALLATRSVDAGRFRRGGGCPGGHCGVAVSKPLAVTPPETTPAPAPVATEAQPATPTYTPAVRATTARRGLFRRRMRYST
jgi:hypothetical protein